MRDHSHSYPQGGFGQPFFPPRPAPEVDPSRLRKRMVREQVEGRGIADPALLRAMGEVPRHLFVPEAFRAHAYEDSPLPIGQGQTISQPHMVARMTAALNARLRFLSMPGRGTVPRCTVV